MVMRKGMVFFVCSLLMLCGLSGAAFAKEKKNITIVLFHSRQPSEENFMRVVNEAYDVNWTEVSANRDKNKAREILEGIDPATTDLVYLYGTSVAQLGREIIVDKKGMAAVYCNSYDPVEAHISDSWERAGANITGGSIKVPAEAQILVLKKLLDFKTLGVIYNPDEKNAVIAWEEAEGIQGKFGYTAVAVPYRGPKEVDEAMRIVKEENVDAILLTAASAIISKPEPITAALAEAKIPNISSLTAVGKKGALLALGVDYGRLGAEVGKAAIRMLRGEDASNMPVVILEKFDLVVNLKTANSMGVSIPLNLLQTATEIIKE
ncbi:MAG: ABC transporter substrate-binding protein [Candidatus Omnitrophota bacterium]